jgi:hypothetical protein
MGLTSYYAKLAFGDRLQIIDTVGLSDDTLYKDGSNVESECIAGQVAPWNKPDKRTDKIFFRNSLEMIMSKHEQFARQALLGDVVAGLPEKPDIIFNVSAKNWITRNASVIAPSSSTRRI